MENLVCQVALLEQQRHWHVREMSITKFYCSEALQELTLRAINVFGGYGVSRDYPVERCRREAVALPLYGGTSEIQWYIIARELLDSISGRGHADYRARDEEARGLLAERSESDEELGELVGRFAAMQGQLWGAVEAVAELKDGVPFHRHLAGGATAFAVAQVLLHQASSTDAGPLERELARLAVDRLQSTLATVEHRIGERAEHDQLLKSIVHDLVV